MLPADHETERPYPASFMKAVERLQAYGLLLGVRLELWPDVWFRRFIDPEEVSLRFWNRCDEDKMAEDVFTVDLPFCLLKDEGTIAEIERRLRRAIETGVWPREVLKIGLARKLSADVSSAAGSGS